MDAGPGQRPCLLVAASVTDSILHLHHPELVPTETDLKEARARLEVPYHDYTLHVSPPQMAIALETAAYTLWVSQRITLRSAVDFGSGFTSYVLRLVCDDVWSVDDSPEWLDWTRTFLDRYRQDTSQLVTWNDYRTRDLTHDLVVYDFSCGQMRDDNFDFAVGQLRAGGIGVMDDANHQDHQTSMHKAARKHGYGLFGLQDWTRDQYHRFAALIVAS